MNLLILNSNLSTKLQNGFYLINYWQRLRIYLRTELSIGLGIELRTELRIELWTELWIELQIELRIELRTKLRIELRTELWTKLTLTLSPNHLAKKLLRTTSLLYSLIYFTAMIHEYSTWREWLWIINKALTRRLVSLGGFVTNGMLYVRATLFQSWDTQAQW